MYVRKFIHALPNSRCRLLFSARSWICIPVPPSLPEAFLALKMFSLACPASSFSQPFSHYHLPEGAFEGIFPPNHSPIKY